MQLEIERQRNAAEANNLMAQTEMFERREIDLIARKDRDAEIERKTPKILRAKNCSGQKVF